MSLSILYIWKRKVSLLVGWLNIPLWTQYQTARSEWSWVVTNWGNPHKEAIVFEFFNLHTRCSLAFSSISFRYSISFYFIIYQIAAKNKFKFPRIFPSLNILAIVKFPTFTWDWWQPRGMAPSNFLWVNGFLKNLFEYLTPIKFESLALSLALIYG